MKHFASAVHANRVINVEVQMNVGILTSVIDLNRILFFHIGRGDVVNTLDLASLTLSERKVVNAFSRWLECLRNAFSGEFVYSHEPSPAFVYNDVGFGSTVIFAVVEVNDRAGFGTFGKSAKKAADLVRRLSS